MQSFIELGILHHVVMHNFGHQNKYEFKIRDILTAGRFQIGDRQFCVEKTMHL